MTKAHMGHALMAKNLARVLALSALGITSISNTKENFVLAPFLATFRAKFCGYGYVVRHPVNSDFFNSLSVNKVCNTLAALIEQLKLKFHI